MKIFISLVKSLTFILWSLRGTMKKLGMGRYGFLLYLQTVLCRKKYENCTVTDVMDHFFYTEQEKEWVKLVPTRYSQLSRYYKCFNWALQTSIRPVLYVDSFWMQYSAFALPKNYQGINFYVFLKFSWDNAATLSEFKSEVWGHQSAKNNILMYCLVIF